MQQNPQPRSRLTLKSIALAMMLTASASIALVADLTPKTTGQVNYIYGGAAQDEQQALNSEAHSYNLSPLFTQGARDEYLADVDVQFTRHGKEVASFHTDGPYRLIKVPSANYNVIAIYQDTTKRVTVQIDSMCNVQLRW